MTLMKTRSILALALLSLPGCSKVRKAPANETAPASYAVDFDTSRGPVRVEVTRSDSPLGADRFYNLVKSGYFNGARFFRVVPGFVIQFGLAADPAVTRAWDVPFPDEPVKAGNVRGSIAFAKPSEPNHRTTQLFINLADNARLDGMGFAAFGRVVSGMEAVDRIYSGDGEKPDQDRITAAGNAYLLKEFPKLDYIRTARIAGAGGR
jgi:peptidyl-prolyl cis-trans isomerase A (cyclophilin A)